MGSWGAERKLSEISPPRLAGDQCHPEEPQLAERPAADKTSRDGAAGRIHRGVSDRDADQVNQSETKSDHDGGEALRRSLVSTVATQPRATSAE